jgi:hypothetical protein
VVGFNVGIIYSEGLLVGFSIGLNVLGNDGGEILRSLDGRLDGLVIGLFVGQI